MANENDKDKSQRQEEFVKTIAETVATATIKAQQQFRVIEDSRPRRVGVLNPPGVKKNKLTRRTIFCGHEEIERQLSPVEIDLYNKVARPGRYHNRRWEVLIRESETGESRGELEIRIPCREINDRLDMPVSLTAILEEIIAEAATKSA